ncbi:MAG: cytochrome P450 [Myxococcota bacterium]|nr:cytochrome P450 [Myxococcota bacterium]
MSAPDLDLEHYDPTDPAVQQEPFPAYAALRRQAPVHRHPRTGVYFVSRHDTVRRVLTDTATFSSRMSNAGTRPASAAVRAELRRIMEGSQPVVDTMITADPPRHTRYRQAAARALAPRRIRALEPAIREIAEELLDAWPAAGRVDAMNSFSVPFPVGVIARLLGLKQGLEADIKRWSDDSVVAIGADVSDERRLEAMRGMAELQRMWVGEIEERRARPGDDVLSELLVTSVDDPDAGPRPLDLPELLSIVQQLMVAGNETTTKLLNELLRLLAEHPGHWERLRREPAWIPQVVEEGLRLASPNQGLFRQAVSDARLEGVAIPAGATLWVMFGSANRDERVFRDPDGFDPDRPELREHLAFGHGPHFCIGAPLARLEVRVALEELARRFERLRLPADFAPRYEPSFILRGLAALELEVASDAD